VNTQYPGLDLLPILAKAQVSQYYPFFPLCTIPQMRYFSPLRRGVFLHQHLSLTGDQPVQVYPEGGVQAPERSAVRFM